ncbi:hypothetical protein Lal_00022912 [Lupinus albus]|nr:hypothetical protein Lal_00022912 [Lupinus albus]
MVTTQTLVTQKRTQHGVTSMKNVVRARSKNIKLTVEWNTKGQPCNNKGGNTLVSYIGVMVRQNVSIKQLLILVSNTRITSSKLLAGLSDNSEPIAGNVSKMLMGMSTSSLQPNMQISLMRRIGWNLSLIAHKMKNSW